MAFPRTFSIRTILVAGFCGLSVIGIGLALLLGLSTAVKNTSELLTENVEDFVRHMAEEVESRIRTIERRTNWAAR